MRIFIPSIKWIGGFQKFFTEAFSDNNVEVVSSSAEVEKSNTLHFFKLHQINRIRQAEQRYFLQKHNENVLRECIQAKPDVFLTFNESHIFPHTIQTIKEKTKCATVCILGDNPWDSSRWPANFPHSIKYFDFIFNPEPTWNVNIRKVAPRTRIYWHCNGFDPEYHFPLDESTLTDEDKANFGCEISFTGTNYGSKSEGAYRAEVLAHVADFDLKIWGDNDWPYRFKFLPELKSRFLGERLPIDDLRKLYTLSKVNLNMPAPQLTTGFQPRVFEIAGAKGFQIIDNRKTFSKVFSPDEIVTFDTIPELREKARYYIDHEKERKEMTEKLYNKVISQYTWNHWARYILEVISHPDDHEMMLGDE